MILYQRVIIYLRAGTISVSTESPRQHTAPSYVADPGEGRTGRVFSFCPTLTGLSNLQS
jgi:hypothetical protein